MIQVPSPTSLNPFSNRFTYLHHDMKYTEILLHRHVPENDFAKLVFFVSILFASALEAIVKNGLFLIANTALFIANQSHAFYQRCCKKIKV